MITAGPAWKAAACAPTEKMPAPTATATPMIDIIPPSQVALELAALFTGFGNGLFDGFCTEQLHSALLFSLLFAHRMRTIPTIEYRRARVSCLLIRLRVRNIWD